MRVGRLEIALRGADKKQPALTETEPAATLSRIRRLTRRRALPILAVAGLVGLPGTVAATQMMAGDSDDLAMEDWGASILDPDDADFVEANWERAMDIEPIYDDGLDLEDEEMEPLAGALGANGIPEVALDAYYNAEDTLAGDDPDCGVPWSLVAAIARVESNHGRFGGAELREDGYGTKPIRGIPLDGRPGVALIRDTDNGALDDDTTFDRAVGPMQFIPTSWPPVSADGNADGQKDPDNIYDATIGTGVYLCGGEGDLLDDPDARYAAVFRYNHSDEYVRTVLSLAEMYEEGGVEELAFEDEGFEDDDFDAEGAAAGALGPELPEPAPPTAPSPAPAPAPAPRPNPAPAPRPNPAPAPAPAPPADVPTLPEPPEDPISVGWPQGMNELPPAELPPAPTPPTTVPPATTVPPTTVPEDPDCPVPAPEDEGQVDEAATTTTASTVPADPTDAEDPDDQAPECETPDDTLAPEAGSDETDEASADGEAAGLATASGDETSAP